ncbi:MAG TPA: metallophosphoesterase [Chitinophagaceae bacterium]|nr:metallophosphoesterase [Chitinophagaceae bacterium]
MARKKYITLFGFLWFLNFTLHAQDDTLSQRIVLIGDAGQLTDGHHPIVDAVKKYIPLDEKTTIIFLGDNLYKTGLPDRQFKLLYDQAKAVLDSQISIADSTPAKVYMIPGNHDWQNGRRNGYDAIVRQQLYVTFSDHKNVTYYPEDGCPGPKAVTLGKDKSIVLIMFDSQWWLHPHDKPGIESDCECKTTDELVNRIKDIATNNSDKLIILACHHPFKSNGPHGGFFTFKQHLFPLTDLRKNLYIPLPIIGSIYPIARSVFGTPQDLKHPVYADMITRISDAIKSSCPNVIFVSGHDHNLQYIKEDGYNYIISGGGCKQNRTSDNKNSLYNNTSEGFAVLDVSKNNNVSVTFYPVADTVKKEQPIPVLNFKTLPKEFKEDTSDIDVNFSQYRNPAIDSITIPASKKFPVVGGLKKLFMGQNYRPEWSEPVKMKVFRLNSEDNGFIVDHLGGGNQTKSLHLINKQSGSGWVLRTVDKNPAGTVPLEFNGTIAEDLLIEMASASHPYGAMVVPPLAKTLNIQTANPRLFFVPDDPALGIYRPLFANKICMLEEKDASIDTTDTKSTATMFGNMILDNDKRPDEKTLLKARLLDFIIGDYDRHFDQWKWGIYDSTRGKAVKGKLYYPIPRDRDQAFFYSDGLLLRLISNKMPFLKGFRDDYPRVKWFGYRAKDFDRFFLTDMNGFEWQSAIAEIQQKLSDSVIRDAVQHLPPEIYKIGGEKLADKMISRRQKLTAAAPKYYKFISKRVNVIGSNQKEYFKVSNIGDSLHVIVYELGKGYDTGFVMFERSFDPKTTKEVRLFGLNDNDYFDVKENTNSKIRLRIIGGRGSDTFNVKGNVNALAYDLKDTLSNNYITKRSKVKNRFSDDPPLNERTILGFNYNTTHFPQLSIGYNSDDGFMVGGIISRKTYGFRNYPYATNQNLSALYSVSRKAIRLDYLGEFNHIFGKTDLVVKSNLALPQLRNFTGFGNNTRFNESAPKNYYLVKYNLFEFEALLRKRFFDNFHVMFGPYFQSYSGKFDKNKTSVFSRPELVGLDSANIFSKKSYLGGKLVMLIDNRNNEIFPTRGMHWRNEFVSVAGIKNGSKSFTAFSSDMSLYASMKTPAKLVMVMKIGGSKIYGKNYEYFQTADIGANDGLYGFRKNRYSGTSSLYGSMEFRIKLFKLNSYILPGTAGLILFADAARVWLKNVSSRTWHSGFGGGVYFMPFNQFVISATAGFADSQKMFIFSLGTKINFTY